MRVQPLGWQEPLEKEMATYSSILAWRISWTEEPEEYSPWGHKESDTENESEGGFPGGPDGQESACCARNLSMIPGLNMTKHHHKCQIIFRYINLKIIFKELGYIS